MLITDALLGEHATLYALFDHLRATALSRGDLDEFHNAALLLESQLAGHAQIEDEILFPALEPHLGRAGPLAVMRSEHESIDHLLRAACDEKHLDAARSALAALLDLAVIHFRKEEQALFPMARQYLDETALTALGDEWAARRGVIVRGAGCSAVG